MTVDADIPRWIKQLRDLAKLTTKELDAIETDILDAIKRDRRTGPVVFTGFPASTSGGSSGGGPKITVTVDGHTEDVPCTRVEKAAIDRPPIQDPLHDQVWATHRSLGEAAHHLGAFRSRVKQLRALTKDVPHVQWCEACSPAGVLHEPDRYARNMRGIDHPMHLCDSASRFIENHGRLPNVEEAAHHDRTGRWRVRIDPKQRHTTNVMRTA